MVRAGGSAAMKVVDISNNVAECIWIDGNGAIRRRFHYLDQLTPFWMTMGAKSLWPDITQIDLIAIEQEERQAVTERQATRRAAKRARRSNKIKRGRAA
jgi:uncharacterized protein YodC (DUF2158 family)